MTVHDKISLCGIVALIAFCVALISFAGCAGVGRPVRAVVTPPIPQMIVHTPRRALDAVIVPPQYRTNYVRLLYPPGSHPSNEIWAVQFSSDLKNWRNVGTNAYGTNAFGYVWWPMYATGFCGFARLKKL